MDKQITGMMVYYNEVCKKKLWYFLNDIQMESENEDVKIGKLLDEGSYNKDEKHINVFNAINIDFIRKDMEIHEIKKSRKIEDASIWQVKYYIWFLKGLGVEGIHGKIDYPLLKKTLTVELTEEDEINLKQKLLEIEEIASMVYPPIDTDMKICNKCAYYDLCKI